MGSLPFCLGKRIYNWAVSCLASRVPLTKIRRLFRIIMIRCLPASHKTPKRRCARDGGPVVADVVQSGSDPVLSVLFEECMHLLG